MARRRWRWLARRRGVAWWRVARRWVEWRWMARRRMARRRLVRRRVARRVVGRRWSLPVFRLRLPLLPLSVCVLPVSVLLSIPIRVRIPYYDASRVGGGTLGVAGHRARAGSATPRVIQRAARARGAAATSRTLGLGPSTHTLNARLQRRVGLFSNLLNTSEGAVQAVPRYPNIGPSDRAERPNRRLLPCSTHEP